MAVKSLLKLGFESITFDLRHLTTRVQAAVEGALLATYRFDDFKPQDARRKHPLRTLELWVGREALAQALPATDVWLCRVCGTMTCWRRLRI